MMKKIYPRTGDTQTVYLNAVVKDPSIEVGDYTIYNDFVSNPLLFGKHSKKCTFYTLRFGCSFAAVNTIKPQLL